MPVYVYRNLRTGETFEVEQRITEPSLTEHPESGDPVKRLIQPVGIAFKGSGFYVTDSRSSSKGSGAKSGSKGSADGSDGSVKDSGGTKEAAASKDSSTAKESGSSKSGSAAAAD